MADEPREVGRRWHDLHLDLERKHYALSDRVGRAETDIHHLDLKLDNNHKEQMSILHRVEAKSEKIERSQHLYAMVWLGIIAALFILVIYAIK